MKNRQANSLLHASSPYLLQHAFNPVNWYEWSDEVWQRARKENKLVLVSIGYAACHWCHVMERETFENETAAALMNQHLICIKVDREERPDVDQIYMEAVQLMTGRGGWPLNMFCLPDKRPIYGGTYYPLHNWLDIIPKLTVLWNESPEKTVEYAEKLTHGIQQSDLISATPIEDISDEQITRAAQMLIAQVDEEEGGINTVPKFPLPSNWRFLLHYGQTKKYDTAIHMALFTLMKMGYGGIYDHIGGGFARYSTDKKWLVPHFEKMLYDNAQLISVFAQAYRITSNPFYKDIIFQCASFLNTELSNGKGGYFSSLDADSEGEEGKFYVWYSKELKDLLQDDFGLFSKLYNISENGNWEEGKNILHHDLPLEELAEDHRISFTAVKEKIAEWRKTLLQARSQRVRPGLDDKIICSWQALTIKAFADAYLATNEPYYKDLAIESATFLREKFINENNELLRIVKNEKRSVDAFFEDYACTIEAFVAVYSVTFNEQWMSLSKLLCDAALENFLDTDASLFYFTAKNKHELIARKTDTGDDVIPSSNSVMCHNLIKLSAYFGNEAWYNLAKKMVLKTGTQMLQHPTAYTNWLSAALTLKHGLKQVVISGNNAQELYNEIRHAADSNTIFAVCNKTESSLPIFKDRISKDGQIFICVDQTCHLPLSAAADALKLLRDLNNQV